MSRRYEPTTNVGQNWRVTLQGPLDIRTVMGTTSDLLSKAAFGATGQQELRYQGMLVAVVEDTPVNNGVYYLKDDPDEVTIEASSWVKLIGLPNDSGVGEGDDYVLEYKNGNFVWERKTIPQNLSDLSDVDIDSGSGIGEGDYLRYNSTTGKWENSSGGSGSDGVTTAEIDYKMLFTPTTEGGMGHEARVEGKDFGFLRETETWHPTSNPSGISTNKKIPIGTSYQEIFEKILTGTQVSLTVNSPQNRTYNSSYQLFGDSNVHLNAPTGYSLYYRVGDNSAWAAYDSSLLKGKDAGTYTWQIRINDDDSTIKTAVLNISKANLTITSGSAEKVFDGTPLTRHTCTFSPNYNDHGLTVNYTGTGTLPGNYQNTFTTSGTLSSNYNSNVSKSPGTLKILPFIQYSIQSNRITVTKDTSVQFADNIQRKISGQSDVYYINGRSGEVQGDTYTFKIYVAGNQVIDTSKLWFFNDSTKAWESSASDVNAWGNINLSSPETITELGATTRVYTYSNISGGVEVPFPNIYVAFKVKNS